MNRRRVRDAVIALVVGFGLGMAVIVANDVRTGRSGELLGRLDIAEYCEETYGDASLGATLFGAGAGGWRCAVRSPIFDLHSINYSAACSAQYGVAAVGSSSDGSPYDWQCYRR